MAHALNEGGCAQVFVSDADSLITNWDQELTWAWNGAHASPPTKPAPDAEPSNGELNGHGANGDANGAPPPANGAPPSATEQMEALTQEMMMMNGGGAAAAANMRARGQHTQVFTDESQNCIVRLHQTNIVTVRQNGDLVLSSGGWRTHQTLKGINTALKTFSPGMQVLPDGHVAEGAWRLGHDELQRICGRFKAAAFGSRLEAQKSCGEIHTLGDRANLDADAQLGVRELDAASRDLNNR